MAGAFAKLFVGDLTIWFSAGSRYAQSEERVAAGLALPVAGLGNGGTRGCLPFDVLDMMVGGKL